MSVTSVWPACSTAQHGLLAQSATLNEAPPRRCEQSRTHALLVRLCLTGCTTHTCLTAAQVRTWASPADVVLPSVTEDQQLQQQEEWLAGEVQLWLDDEWTPLEIHKDLGKATAKVCNFAYKNCAPPGAAITVKIIVMPDMADAPAGIWQSTQARCCRDWRSPAQHKLRSVKLQFQRNFCQRV